MGAMCTKRFLTRKANRNYNSLRLRRIYEGAVIAQFVTKFYQDTIETIEKKVRHLESLHFVEVVGARLKNYIPNEFKAVSNRYLLTLSNHSRNP